MYILVLSMNNCTPLNKGTGKFDTEGFFDILNIQLNRQTIHFTEKALTIESTISSL